MTLVSILALLLGAAHPSAAQEGEAGAGEAVREALRSRSAVHVTVRQLRESHEDAAILEATVGVIRRRGSELDPLARQNAYSLLAQLGEHGPRGLQLGDRRQVELLIRGLEDPDGGVRGYCATFLARVDPALDALAAPGLVAALGDPELTVVASAADTLGKLGAAGSAAVPRLVEMVASAESLPAEPDPAIHGDRRVRKTRSLAAWAALRCAADAGAVLTRFEGLPEETLDGIIFDALLRLTFETGGTYDDLSPHRDRIVALLLEGIARPGAAERLQQTSLHAFSFLLGDDQEEDLSNRVREAVTRLRGPATERLLRELDHLLGTELLPGTNEPPPPDDRQVVAWRPRSRLVGLARVPAELGGVWALSFTERQAVPWSARPKGSSTLHVWNAATGERLHRLADHPGLQRDADVSPDGRRAVVSTTIDEGGETCVWVWDLGGEPRRRPLGTTGTADKVRFSAGSERVSAQHADGTIHVWSTSDGRELARLQGPPGGVHEPTPDGRRILAGGRTLELLHVATGETLWSLDAASNVQALAVSPDGERALVGHREGALSLRDLDTGQVLSELGAAGAGVRSAAFSSDGLRALSASFGFLGETRVPSSIDYSVRIWDLATGAETARFTGCSVPAVDVAFVPGAQSPGRVVAAGALVRLWEDREHR